MSRIEADFIIIGSTPLARLLAGLLASVHGKSVVFLGESQSGYRLPRGLDLSITPMTRPQSWALLKTLVPETLKLVSRIGGRGAWSRVDPILFAERPMGREALAHVRHMAQAFGHGVEPVSSVGAGREGIVFRDAALLHRPALELGLDRWLEQSNVRRATSQDRLTIHPDGSAELISGDDQIEIGQSVLADDRALLAHIPSSAWPSLLSRRVASTIITEPTKPIAAPVLLQVETGQMLMQSPTRGITAIGPGVLDGFAARLATLLGQERAFRHAGQSRHDMVTTADNAPAVGRLAGPGPDVLAGFGPSGAFFAPAIARWLCGAATDAENTWLGERLVDRQHASSPVADVGPLP